VHISDARDDEADTSRCEIFIHLELILGDMAFFPHSRHRWRTGRNGFARSCSLSLQIQTRRSLENRLRGFRFTAERCRARSPFSRSSRDTLWAAPSPVSTTWVLVRSHSFFDERTNLLGTWHSFQAAIPRVRHLFAKSGRHTQHRGFAHRGACRGSPPPLGVNVVTARSPCPSWVNNVKCSPLHLSREIPVWSQPPRRVPSVASGWWR